MKALFLASACLVLMACGSSVESAPKSATTYAKPPQKPKPIQCWDGSTVKPPATCPVEPPPVEPIQCEDGSTVIPPATCPIIPPPVDPLTVIITPVTVTEGIDLTANIVVTRSGGDLNQSATVGWSTANDSAVAPGDYAARSGSVTMSAGVLSRSVGSFPINNDTLAETPERVKVRATVTQGNQSVIAYEYFIINSDDEEPIQCSDGSQVPAGGTCPIITWLPDRLHEGGYARALSNCKAWSPIKLSPVKPNGMYDPIYSQLVTGVIYPVRVWAWGSDTALGGKDIWVLDIGAGILDYFHASCLEGVKPSS